MNSKKLNLILEQISRIGIQQMSKLAVHPLAYKHNIALFSNFTSKASA